MLPATVVVTVLVIVGWSRERQLLARVAPSRSATSSTSSSDGQTAVREGNDITLVTAARDRAGAACAPCCRATGRVEDWVGTIEEVGTVSGGKQGQLSGDDQLTTSSCDTWSRESEDAKRPTP